MAIITTKKGRQLDGLSFSELEALTNAYASLFQDAGISRGTRVLLMAKPGLGLIATVFALFKLGAPPIVIDPGMGIKGFLRCVEHSRPEALVGIPLAHRLSKVFRRSFSSVRHRVRLDKEFLKNARLMGDSGFEMSATKPDELAAVLFTSGSTGPAKGVCYEHVMFEEQVKSLKQQFGFQQGEVDLPMLPIFALFNPALGMTTVVPEMNPSRPAKVDPSVIVRAIEKYKVTNSFGSPVLWRKIVDYCESAGKELSTLKRVLIAGAPVAPDTIRRLKVLMPEGEVHTPYGATEVLPVSSIRGSDILEDTWLKTEQGQGTCVGNTLPGVEARIIEIKEEPIFELSKTNSLPQGELGEIIVTGPTVTKSYDWLPKATAMAKISDEGTTWHRMGDLGYFDTNGRLWFCGRKAERVVTQNGPLYTDSVEGIFNTHPEVFRTALIGVGMRPRQIPVLAIEPLKWPMRPDESKRLLLSLKEIGSKYEHTKSITSFVFRKKFPVDVRHNAKINRLTLASQKLTSLWTTALEEPQLVRVSSV